MSLMEEYLNDVENNLKVVRLSEENMEIKTNITIILSELGGKAVSNALGLYGAYCTTCTISKKRMLITWNVSLKDSK